MRFLGGLLKFLSILILVAATAICTLLCVMAGVLEAYLIMGLAWVCALFVALNIWGTGMALSRLRKLEKKVEQLEQRLAVPAIQFPVAEVVPEAVPEVAPQPIVQASAEPVVPAKKKSKKWLPAVIIAAVAVIAAAIVVVILVMGGKQGPAGEYPQIVTTTPEEEASRVITVNGICVDDSYVDEDGSPLKMVYLFYTINADNSNLQIDSKYTKMFINGNEYESDHFADAAAACKYTPNYYYSSYIEDVYVGSSLNVVATFYIPEGDLTAGKTVTLQDTQIPGAETLSFSTDEFQHFASPEDIAMAMDPEGYESNMIAREEADEATAQLVRNQLNGYYWTFYVNNTSYQLEFWAPDNFSVTTAFGTNTGTYSVRNGYIFCTYPNTGYTVEIPYELVDGELDLDTIGGFDVRG